jgi:hypothetical protein
LLLVFLASLSLRGGLFVCPFGCLSVIRWVNFHAFQQQGIQKELHAITSKKRKGDDDDLDMLDVKLQDFNCEDMDQMKIDSNLDISEGEMSDEIST